MRTGKLTGETKVMIPYFDTEGKRHFNMIVIRGPIYASKMYSGIRKFVYDNYGVTVDRDWLHNVPLIVNSNDPEVQVTEAEKNRIVEAFIDHMELKDDETEDDTDSTNENLLAPEAGESLCTVQNQPE